MQVQFERSGWEVLEFAEFVEFEILGVFSEVIIPMKGKFYLAFLRLQTIFKYKNNTVSWYIYFLGFNLADVKLYIIHV